MKNSKNLETKKKLGQIHWTLFLDLHTTRKDLKYDSFELNNKRWYLWILSCDIVDNKSSKKSFLKNTLFLDTFFKKNIKSIPPNPQVVFFLPSRLLPHFLFYVASILVLASLKRNRWNLNQLIKYVWRRRKNNRRFYALEGKKKVSWYMSITIFDHSKTTLE